MSKPMNVEEVSETVRELQTWIGAQFQEVVVDGLKGEDPRSIRLGFFWTGGVRWIVFDYRVQAPLLLIFDGQDGVPMVPPKTAGKIRRPIELFLRSKHIGRRLRDVRIHPDDPRALDLVFDPTEDGGEVSLELKVYPHGRNARAVSGAQSVAEFKPMAGAKVSSVAAVVPHASDSVERAVRSRSELVIEWLNFVRPNGSSQKKTQIAGRANSTKSPGEIKLEKKRKALAKVRAEIQAKEQSPARTIGEWLKAEQTLEVPKDWPAEWRELIDARKSLAFNIEKLFSLAKLQARKLDGTRARAEEIEREIVTLEKKIRSGQDMTDASAAQRESAPKDLFKAADARGRKFQLAEDLIVYLGKNAAENLAILRKAQPFDYWLHLRDRPGAHAILRRTRGRVVTDQELIRAGVYVAEQTMKRRAIELRGEAFDLLIVECRFVRPIKGDRLGRVHYTNDRVLRLSL